jgi:DNA-binding transcriptional LysR family regulator
MDRLESMATLLAAVETGSLSAASRKLGMPLATVSRKVSELEDYLRVRLFVRGSRRLTLTEAGRAYVASCKQILEDISEAERVAAGEYRAPQGDLVITGPIVFGRLHIVPVVVEFLKAYPDINVRLLLADRVVNLLEEQIDVAVRIGELPDSSLIATRVGAIRRIVCASPAYFESHGAPLMPDELAGHPCVTFEGLTAPDRWSFVEGMRAFSVPVRSRLVVNTADAAIDAAIAAIGITRVLSYQAADALRAGQLSVALKAFEAPPSPVSLVTIGQPLLPIKLRAFLDFAVPRLKARLKLAEVAEQGHKNF